MNRHLCIGLSAAISLAACGGSDANEGDRDVSDVRTDLSDADTTEDTARPEDTAEDTDPPEVCAGPSTCDDGDPCTEDSVVSGAFATCDLVCAHRGIAGDADLPDDDFLDTNCDGVDGTAAALVFVAPDGADDDRCGTTAAPCATIGYALGLAKAAAKDVAVSAGVYDERVTLIEGVSLYGGYDRAAAWERDDDSHAVIASSAVFTDGDAAFLEGMLARDLTQETIVDRVIVRTPDAPSERAGVSNHGLRVLRSPGLVLRYLLVEAGAATAGSGGARGAPGPNGRDGESGGGFFSMLGGSPSALPACEGINASHAGRRGGDGGADGVPALPGTVGSVVKRPMPGWDVPECGLPGGAAGRNWDNLPLDDVPGSNGGPGQSCTLSGAPGAGGLAAVGLAAVEGDLLAHGVGDAGRTGAHGFGGAGGGGGGSGDADTLVAGADGGGGGGGSGGGCGGLGGEAGAPGGSSVGLIAVDSEGFVVVHSRFGAGAGGAGGAGGESGGGGFPGTPGSGANGSTTDTAGGLAINPHNSFRGGDGGRGSNGAMGGGGAGGNGGQSLGVMLCRSSLGETSLDNTITAGAPGAGGRGGYPFGQDGFVGRAAATFTGCFIPAVDVRFGYSLEPNTDAARLELLDFPTGAAAPGWDGAPLGCGEGRVWLAAVGNVAVVGGSWLCVAPKRVNGRYFIQNDERQRAVMVVDGKPSEAELLPVGECPFGGLVAFVGLGSDDTSPATPAPPAPPAPPATWACYEAPPSTWRWDFRESAEGWNPGQASVSVAPPGLSLTAITGDPWLDSSEVHIDTALSKIRARMKVSAGSAASIYFMRAGEGASEERVVTAPIAPSSELVEVVFDMGAHPLWTGVVTRLRFDFTNTLGKAELDFIALEP